MGKSKRIKFESTWCDYLTPCPFKFRDEASGPYVGDYDCSKCEFRVNQNTHEKTPKTPPTTESYARYFVKTKGYILCRHE